MRLGREAPARHDAYQPAVTPRIVAPRARLAELSRDSGASAQGALMVLVDTSVWIGFLAKRCAFKGAAFFSIGHLQPS